MSLISDLWELQEIDVALDARRSSLIEAEAQLGETDELVASRARVANASVALAAAQRAQRDLEHEADDLRAKVAPLEAKLYNGSIRQPKELAGLQADIDQLKRHLSSIEDRDLEALSALEATEAESREASGTASAVEAEWRTEQSVLGDRVSALRGEVVALTGRRESQAAQMSDDVLRMYDRLRAAHQGRALARLARNLCTGCRISLPTNLVTRARAGYAIVHCPNCERILIPER
jgi:predicted  nucleic acid-binding Zn-ribbon protein